MDRDTLKECEKDTLFIADDNVFVVLGKDRWMLKLQQLAYDIDAEDGIKTFKSVDDFLDAIDDCDERYYQNAEYDYEVFIVRCGEPFFQHYKDIEDPDFDVPYEDTY